MTTRAKPGGKADYLLTDHLVQNLKARAISGGLVTATAQGAKFVLNFGSAVVLARLLSPAEFGLVGMVLAVTNLLGLLNDAGLSTATVQRETISHEQVSNLFWLNVGLSSTGAALTVALVPFITWFYGDPRLSGIMLALSLTFLLTGPTVQHQALLTRQMRFRALAVIEVVSMLTGIVAACGLALSGLAYWALVGQQLSTAAAALVLTWWTSGWRPSLPRRHSRIRPLLSFGAQLTASDLVGRLAVSSDRILIGRFFGAEPLGLYSRAGVLLARPLEQLLNPIGSVLIPVLSRLQSDPERYRRTFLRAYDTLALLTFPFTALCLVLAEPLVLLVFGPRWQGVVPLFAAFTLVALSLPMLIAASWLFMSQGRGADLFQTYLVLSLVTVAAYVIGLHWGPQGIVLALAVVSLLIRQPILYHLAGRRGPVRTSDLWRVFLSHLPSWLVVYAATTLALRTLGNAEPLVQVLVCGPVGGLAAAVVVLALKRPRQSALYTWAMIRTSVGRQWSSAV